MSPKGGSSVDKKKYVLGSIVVFAAYMVFDYLVYQGILRGTYESEPLRKLWRPDIADKMWILWLVNVAWSFLFSLIYIKGYEGRGGMMEGVRFGFWIGLFVAGPMAFAQYVVYPIPFFLAVQWFIFGTVQTVICGAALALVYRPVKPAVRAAGE
jgi:hypothetical protein